MQCDTHQLTRAELRDALNHLTLAVCVTSTQLDSPGPIIEFANDAYVELFCRDRSDVVGASPRHGQGPLTDRRVLDEIKKQLAEQRPVRAELINYRSSGEPFRLRLRADPVFRDGDLHNFIAVHTDATAESKLRHRLDATSSFDRRLRELLAPNLRHDDEEIAVAMVVAIDVLLTGIGRAAVRLGETVVGPRTPAIVDHRTVELPIAGYGAATLQVHSGAGALYDERAVIDLLGHCALAFDLMGHR